MMASRPNFKGCARQSVHLHQRPPSTRQPAILRSEGAVDALQMSYQYELLGLDGLRLISGRDVDTLSRFIQKKTTILRGL
jgi:hypothetical protein